MDAKDFDRRWNELAEEVMTGMAEWRVQHPRATFRQTHAPASWAGVETALDERLARTRTCCAVGAGVRARMLQDLALASTAADWGQAPEHEHPLCPQCGQPLELESQHTCLRQCAGIPGICKHKAVRTWRWNGTTALARPAAPGFFPLDEELELLAGSLSPWLYETRSVARLGTWMPFPRAAQMLAAFTRVTVSDDVARDRAEAAGAAQVALQTAEVERLERETPPAPPAPPGPDQQYWSADGAMVPLVGGTWAEVNSVVIGEVGAPVLDAKHHEWVVRTHHLSYFSRLATADTFDRLALVETHRRGVENAGQVAAVVDGAEWLQGFADWHRRDALRILDFPHAGSYVAKIGQATWGADTPELAGWLATQLHELKHAGPQPVLATLRDMVAENPQAEALELPQALAYLEKRQAQTPAPSLTCVAAGKRQAVRCVWTIRLFRRKAGRSPAVRPRVAISWWSKLG